MKITYKIELKGLYTIVYEYWDDLQIYKHVVSSVYYGGNIVEFLRKNNSYKSVNFVNLEKFLQRTQILDY